MNDVSNIKIGMKVCFTGKNGTDFDLTHANRHLEIGREYTISQIMMGDWHTIVQLEECGLEWFNSVHFEEVIKEEIK